MSRSITYLLAAASLGGAIAFAGPSSAAPSDPVTVSQDNGGVQVGVGLPGRPLVGAKADNTGICYGATYTAPYCLPVGIHK